MEFLLIRFSEDKARQSLLQSLRPELVNRIDEVITFNNLKIRDMKNCQKHAKGDIWPDCELGLEIEVDDGL